MDIAWLYVRMAVEGATDVDSRNASVALSVFVVGHCDQVYGGGHRPLENVNLVHLGIDPLDALACSMSTGIGATFGVAMTGAGVVI